MTDILPFNTARASVVELAANTLAEQVISLPFSRLGRGRAIAPRIKRIFFDLSIPSDADPGAGSNSTSLVRVSLSALQDRTVIPRFEDEGFIAGATALANIIGDGGYGLAFNHMMWDYAPDGLLVPTTELSLYLIGTGEASAAGAGVIIAYKLEEVEPDELINAMTLFGLV